MDYFDKSKITKWLKSLVIGLVALIVFFGSIKIIDQTEVGIVRQFGRVTGTLEPGISFVIPIINTVTKYDTKVHRQTIEFESYTKDAQLVNVQAEIQYHLLNSKAMDVAIQYGNYIQLEEKLSNVAVEKIKTVIAKLSAMTLMETRDTLSAKALLEVETLEDLFCIDFTSVIVSDLAFSDAFETSVEEKMKAEQSALRAEQQKKEAITKAEQDRETAKINAEAAIAKANGEAEALRITKNALSEMPEAYIKQKFIDAWDGKLPLIVGNGDNPFILPSEFLAGDR